MLLHKSEFLKLNVGDLNKMQFLNNTGRSTLINYLSAARLLFENKVRKYSFQIDN